MWNLYLKIYFAISGLVSSRHRYQLIYLYNLQINRILRLIILSTRIRIFNDFVKSSDILSIDLALIIMSSAADRFGWVEFWISNICRCCLWTGVYSGKNQNKYSKFDTSKFSCRGHKFCQRKWEIFSNFSGLLRISKLW